MTVKFLTIEHGTPQWHQAVKLRENILRKPLGSVFTPEELEEEKQHTQVVGILNNEIIATAVLVPEGKFLKMQRVVVSDNLRNGNIGSKMITCCEELGRKQGFEIMYCHARNTAVKFYKNNGYKAEGEYFDEDGIPHLKMSKELLNVEL